MPEKKKIYTDSGIEVKEVYTSGPSNGEAPGEFPFTRGVQPDMYRGKLWTMRQYAGFSTAEESNKRYHYLLSQGVMGLSVAFDLPTQIGYDSDHALAEGEVGKVGVAINSLRDMEDLFNGTMTTTVNADVGVLAPGQNVTITMNITVTSNHSQGHTLRLRVDPDGTLPETNEGNNQREVPYSPLAQGDCP